MNELSVIFNKIGIDTKEVLEAATTKWNFLNFYPGLVGGHCIGVDPYYLTYRAEELGYHPEVLLAGRQINDNMGKYIAENTIKQLIKIICPIENAKVLIMGIAFKENVPDIRNSKVIDIINELKDYRIDALISDPIASEREVEEMYNLKLTEFDSIKEVDAVIFAIAHEEYKKINLEDLKKLYRHAEPLLIDVKGIFNKSEVLNLGFKYWRL